MSSQLRSYESLGMIATALYGDVYKLRHLETGELVALKHMDLVSAARRRTKDSNRPIEEDVFAEVQTNMKLRKLGGHPHIVAMHDCFADATSVSLLTEFCTGGELLEVVNARGSLLSVEDALRYFHQIAQAVAFLHKHNIAHRDLSLENVLVDRNDCCKLSDFGMTTITTRQRVTGIGKVHYMAPEACRDVDQDDSFYNPFEADMWSLGVILVTLLTGQYPFANALESDAHFRLLSTFGIEYLLERLNFEMDGYEDVVDLLHVLLAVAPAERATAEQLLTHECFELFTSVEELMLQIDAENADDEEEVEEEGEREAEEEDERTQEDEESESSQVQVIKMETVGVEDVVEEEEVDNCNPADEIEEENDDEDEREDEVETVAPARTSQRCGVVGLFALRRPPAIDTLAARRLCSFGKSSRKSPAHTLKEQHNSSVVLLTPKPHVLSTHRTTRESRDTREGGSRTPPRRSSPKYAKKKCMLRGMFDGVFRRKKTARGSAATTRGTHVESGARSPLQ